MSDGKVYRPHADSARGPSSFRSYRLRIWDCGMRIKRGSAFQSRIPQSEIRNKLNSAPLRRTTTVVRDGRRVAYGRDANPRAVDGADGRLTAAARPLYVYFGLLHPDLFGFVGSLVRGLLRGEG